MPELRIKPFPENLKTLNMTLSGRSESNSLSDAMFTCSENKQVCGDIMRQAPVSVFTRAGIARRSGKGISISLGNRTFYVPPDEVCGLFSDRNAMILNDEGEQEGMAWLSPVMAKKKQDLTALIQDRLFLVSCRDLHALLSGEREGIRVREYHTDRAV